MSKTKINDTAKVDMRQYVGPFTPDDQPLIDRFKEQNVQAAIDASGLKELYRLIYLAASGAFHLHTDIGKKVEAEIKKRNRKIEAAESSQ